ncbi:peptidoglycan-binding domain-containing protein [Anaeromyxobacter oryzae]|uniref:Peptidoglycan binding-like domain-containing protein n=1 Tax=Anaeromyxobacter oryzae TaxID=2918170 RepID=A0ABM7WNN6_9BACT|nr:peptidoglycan-binding protein [Anaeromyxobacter oryzae]BDG01077.1 hypothetical protein AMOR_00730 [Anaeromyxobacter oryzae]
MSRRAAVILLLGALAAGCPKRHPEERVREEQRPEQPDRPQASGVPPREGRPRVPASPEGLLAPGAVGDLQQALADRGYLAAHRRGELDEPTTRALERFQGHEGLAETGVPDRETLRRLGISPEKAYGR